MSQPEEPQDPRAPQPPPQPQPQPPQPQPPPQFRSSLDKYYKDWERRVASMKSQAARVDWGKVDWSKVEPSDIGVRMGPVMTEDQFRKYREKNKNVAVIGSLGNATSKKP